MTFHQKLTEHASFELGMSHSKTLGSDDDRVLTEATEHVPCCFAQISQRHCQTSPSNPKWEWVEKSGKETIIYSWFYQINGLLGQTYIYIFKLSDKSCHTTGIIIISYTNIMTSTMYMFFYLK